MPGFDEALRAIDTWISEGVVRGAAAAIWHDGHIVATREAGEMREGQAVTDRTLFALASVSKPLSAAAVLHAVDAGDLALDMPVASIVPEFGTVADPFDADVLPPLEALRETITVRQLLCHVSGLPENAGTRRVRTRDQLPLERIVDVMCGLPLQAAPGERLRYSNAGIGVVARAVEHASGRAIHYYVDESVVRPLGLADTLTRPGPQDDERIAFTDDAASPGTPFESYNSRYWRDLGMPWAGYFASASDMARFAASFFTGVRGPLSEESRAEMIRDQTHGVPGGVDSAGVFWERGAWGLGWEVAAGKPRHWTGTKRSPATFCHWGQSGTLVWADPARRLAMAVFGNRTVQRPWPLVPARWARLSDTVIDAADAG